jgi:hypothetical protein
MESAVQHFLPTLRSNLVATIILSYYGDFITARELLKMLSHRSRLFLNNNQELLMCFCLVKSKETVSFHTAASGFTRPYINRKVESLGFIEMSDNLYLVKDLAERSKCFGNITLGN